MNYIEIRSQWLILYLKAKTKSPQKKLEHLLTEWPAAEIPPQSKYIISHYN